MSTSSAELRIHDAEKGNPNPEGNFGNVSVKPDHSAAEDPKPEKSDAVPAPAFNLYAAPFPEGGKQAWLTVAGAAAFLFVSFGWVNSIGIFQEYYQEDLLKEYSPSVIAWIPSLMLLFMFIGGILVGKFFDDEGPKYLLALGTFLHVIGLMLTSVSTQYVQILLCQGVVSALGCAMLLFPAVSCISTWFRAKRGMALGLVMGASSLGGVIFPSMVTRLLPQVGFGWTIRICAFLILALCIFGNFTVRSRFPPSKKPFELKAYIRPFKDPTFAFISFGVFLFWWGLFIPIDFIVADAIYRGFNVKLARYLVPILNATGIIGRIVPNAVADKIGHFNVMITFAALSTVLVLGVLLPTHSEGAFIVFTALFGITSGAVIGLAPVLTATVSPIQEIGSRTGTAFFLAGFAALTGLPIGGQLIVASNGDYFNTFLFGGITCAAGTVSFIIARTKHVGFKFGKA